MPEGLTLPEVGVMMVVDLRYRIHPRLGMLQTAFIPHIAQKMDPSDIPDDAKEALKAQDAYALDAGVVGLEIVNWRKLVDGRGGDPLADLDPNICVWSMN